MKVYAIRNREGFYYRPAGCHFRQKWVNLDRAKIFPKIGPANSTIGQLRLGPAIYVQEFELIQSLTESKWQSIETSPKTGRFLVRIFLPINDSTIAEIGHWSSSFQSGIGILLNDAGFAISGKLRGWQPLPQLD